jgi:hypothetical protein
VINEGKRGKREGERDEKSKIGDLINSETEGKSKTIKY